MKKPTTPVVSNPDAWRIQLGMVVDKTLDNAPAVFSTNRNAIDLRRIPERTDRLTNG